MITALLRATKHLHKIRNTFLPMLKNLLSISLVITVLAVCAVPLEAQSQSEMEQSLLPDIDPQDIEIRSQFQARFPGLNRQPILGFNPRPRVFQIDPDRMPFIEDEEAILASLPIGRLDRPEPPEFSPLGYSAPKHLFLRGGIGSDITPEADLFAVGKINNKNWVSGNIRHHSSNGHDNEQVNTSYRFLDASVRSNSRISDKTTVHADVGVQSNFNHFLQLDTEREGLKDINSKVDVNGFRAGIDLAHSKTSITGLKFAAGGYANDFSLTSQLANLGSASAKEWGINAAGEYSRLGKNINEIHRIRLKTSVGGIDPASRDIDSGNWSVSTLSAHFERLFNYNTDIKASAGASFVTESEQDAVIYFSPRAEIEHTFFRGFTLKAEAYGTPNHRALLDVQKENRFFDLSSNLRHQYTMGAQAEAQLEPFYGTKLVGGVSFQDVKNFLYYSRVSNPYNVQSINQGYYTTEFDDATIFKLYGGFTQDLKPDVFWIAADGYWQRPKLTDTEIKIPFTETLSLSATISFRPIKELLIEGWGEIKSGREDHEENEMSSYVTLGSRFEISITDRFGVYGKLLNLLDEDYEYWSGFREHGFRGFVGFTLLL